MFDKYEFTRDWKNPTDFPTVETDEAIVRADMQALHDETKNALHKLVEALFAASATQHIGTTDKDGNRAVLSAVLKSLLDIAHSHENLEELERLVTEFADKSVTEILTDDPNAIPTAKAVLEQITDLGAGDMLKAVYDPQGKEADVFAYADSAADKKAPKVHQHSANDVTSGTLPITRGGTGAGTADEARTALGAAASSHNHSAANITSGTLGVARGGTGKATHTANAVLTGNGTSAVNDVATASGALFATAANGAAKFGTLPIAQGGTGATTAEKAADSLGALFLNLIEDAGKMIANNDDLNDYRTPGSYRCSLASTAATLANMCPYSGTGFRMIVCNTSTANAVIQIMIFNSTLGHIYYRVYQSSGVWTGWRKVMSNILTNMEYGTTLPTAGTAGRIFFKKVT